MSTKLFSNGKGAYSLRSRPDFYDADLADLACTIEVHTFATHRDADFFLEGINASRVPDLKTEGPVEVEDKRYGILLVWPKEEESYGEFHH